MYSYLCVGCLSQNNRKMLSEKVEKNKLEGSKNEGWGWGGVGVANEISSNTLEGCSMLLVAQLTKSYV